MNPVLLLAGCGVIAVTLFDAAMTTLSLSGAGPVTGRTTRILGKGLGRSGVSRPTTGPLLLASILITWLALMWGGWALIYLSHPQAVVAADGGAPAAALDRIYFTGTTLFTLGPGDLIGGSSGWRIASAITALNGLAMITLGISYLIPIVSAAVDKRTLAGYVAGLGRSPRAILQGAWDGDGFDRLIRHVPTLSGMIEVHARHHLAYPIVHHFGSGTSRTAVAPRLAALDDAILLIDHGLAEPARPDRGALEPLRSVLREFVDLMNESFIVVADEAPPPPRLEWLRELGAPVADETAFAEAVGRMEAHRRRVLGLLHSQGWGWEDVAGEDEFDPGPGAEADPTADDSFESSGGT